MFKIIKNLKFLLYTLSFILFIFLPLNAVLSSEDTYPAEAPIVCVGEVIKTVCASGCDYTTIQEAVDASQPGWTIQVKNGIYTSGGQDTSVVNIIGKSGTKSKPICLQNFPGHNPIIDPTGDVVTQSPYQKGINIFNSKWWIIEGFEIRHGWEGIKIQPQSSGSSSNITIRNNYIHDNNFAGIAPHNATDIYIAHNEISSNGDDTNECLEYNPNKKNCHNIYIKYNPKVGTTIPERITIRGNFLYKGSGGAIHVYERGTNILIENNLIIVDGVWGIVSSIENSTIRNNTILIIDPLPIETGLTYYVLIDFRFGTSTRSNNKIVNNIFYTTTTSFNNKTVYMIGTPDKPEIDTWTVDYNLWYTPPNTKWIWKDKSKTDFNSEYKSTTGWDKNGPPIPSDPQFLDLSQHNYSIRSSSPAIDNGDPMSASKLDFTRKPRDSKPDIGAYEY